MHGNARLTPVGRLTMVMRIESGRPVAHVAAEMGISRPTAYKWWRRWRGRGSRRVSVDRSSRPRSCPHRTPRQLEAADRVSCVEHRKLGTGSYRRDLGVPASTVHRVLVSSGLNRLAWSTGRPVESIRRIHDGRPGELVHVDMKKLGRIPDGGGWRVHGPRRNGANTQARSATTTCTRPSTPTAGRVQRDPRRRRRTDLRRLLPSQRFFAEPRHHHRTGPHRQRPRLPQPRLARRARRHRPPPHPALHAPHQRQSRTLQPDPRSTNGPTSAPTAQTTERAARP